MVKNLLETRLRGGFDPWVRKIPWRREWLPSPVFLPGEFHGQRSQAGYSPLGRKSRTRLTLSHVHIIGSGVPKLCLSHGHCQLSHYFGKGLLPWSPLLRVHLCGLCISWTAFCSWETAVAVWLGNSSGVRLPACAACCFIGVTLGRIPKLSVPQLLICKMG